MNPLLSSPGKSSNNERNVPTNVSVGHRSLVICRSKETERGHLVRLGCHSQRGVALVIILAFIVLLTGVVVAFFSRAISERQVSNSSASQTKSEIFAQGAVDQIIGDLKQEIVDGSNLTSITTGSVTTNIYAPKPSSAGAVSTIVPAFQGFTPTITAGIQTDGLANLVKRSTYDVKFYDKTSNSNYAVDGVKRAANISTAGIRINETTPVGPSQNGRSLSQARWNKPLLIQPTSAIVLTPSTTAFKAPDWILVGRDGSNPQVVTTSTSAANYVMGRYAYNIYDGGGLLDANVVGSPVDSSTAKPLGIIAPYKNALAYTDLSQLPGFFNSTSATKLSATDTATVINALVGWRNYASALPGSGTFPSFSTFATPSPPSLLTPSELSNLQNLKGFLSPSNTALAGGQSDRAFNGRQQLIDLLHSIGGDATTPGPVASFTPALQQQMLLYLTTFSRSLNQPSYAPDSARPKIVGPGSSGGNNGNGGDDAINFSATSGGLLGVRVTAAFTRNDGSQAKVGEEPLVKQRFALNKIAWITYKGVSSSRNLTPPSTVFSWVPPASPSGLDYDIYLLKNNYGISASQLEAGNAANVYKYFGLSWVADNRNDPSGAPIGGNLMKWVYDHSRANPASGATTSPFTSLPAAAGGPIKTLTQVAASGRDPDFFELLKAAITVGSLAKPGTASGAAGTPGDYNYRNDITPDAAIIKIGANIIDQFDTDGMPSAILFNDGGWIDPVSSNPVPQEIRGVEDIAYFLRVRGGSMKVHDSNPPTTSGQPGYRDGRPWLENNPPLVDAGVGAFFQVPEIWNPHAWSNTTGNPIGPRPAAFRLFALAQVPTRAAPPSPDPSSITMQAGHRYNTAGTQPNNPGPQSASIDTPPQAPFSLTAINTELDFNIPTNRLDLFREPTFLNKPNVPTGSSLASGANHAVKTAAALSSYIVNGELKSKPADNIPIGQQYSANSAPDDGTYLGIYLGAFPLRFVNSVDFPDPDGPAGPLPDPAATNYVLTARGADIRGTAPGMTYRMQCQDPSNSSRWITYDEKYTDLVGPPANGGGSSDFPYFDNTQMAPDGFVRTFIDPRTSRFGGFSSLGTVAGQVPPLSRWAGGSNGLGGSPNYNQPRQAGWAGPSGTYYAAQYTNAATQNALWTARPDENSGSAFDIPFGNNATTALAYGWHFTAPIQNFRLGVIPQNNPAASNGLNRFRNGPYNGGEANASGPQYFSDPDGVVRRGMSAYTQPTAAGAAADPNFPTNHPGASSGLPMSIATDYSSASPIPIANQMTNRPMILNRPFKSVAELGYVFSGTPWRNLDFATPESGNAAILDVFCINESDDSSALVAGKINLNTRQTAVLQALLAGAYKDELTPVTTSLSATGTVSAQTIAAGLVTRTSDVSSANITMGSGPVINLSDLVGKFIAKKDSTGSTVTTRPFDGGQSYSGFSGTTTTSSAPPISPPNLSAILAADTSASGITTSNLQRYREATVRALSSAGNTRTWNLMIDVVAQTGRYSANALTLDKFTVEGEQRYWVHVAIDRYTGKVIEKQTEVVKE